MDKPFRWNLARQEQLGRLVEPRNPASPPDFLAELQRCCVRILARAGDAELFFVGRSPENMFDYLSGTLAGTAWAARCSMINVSLYERSLAELRAMSPDTLPAIRAQLAAAGLGPDQIRRRGYPTALVDLVSQGSTFGALVELWLDWARGSGGDAAGIRRRLRFVGITRRQKTSPKTWRWQQHAPWAGQFQPGMIKNISIDADLWRYLANDQPKVEPSNPPWRWTQAGLALPRDEKTLAALQGALDLYRLGQSPEHRRAFASLMAREQTAMRAAWFRALAGEIRG
ncbi:MAG TPA: hypothetical protein VD886_09365 [Herpetosiphonaceae bacterium]|nr:hypothetical protein [Herpetosiphonaceae bacterium]